MVPRSVILLWVSLINCAGTQVLGELGEVADGLARGLWLS